MLCRALLAAIAISYLLCVLFLSGIQKEDLDVSLLKKLQRHNIDLNNDDFHAECNKSQTKINPDKSDAKHQDSTTKGLKTNDEVTTLEKHLAELNATELEDMLTYLKQKKKSRISEPKPILKIVTSIKFNDVKQPAKTNMTTTSPDIKINNTDPLQLKEEPIQNIINFYESYIKHLTSKGLPENDSDIKTESPNVYINEEQNNNSTGGNKNEVERIGKIVAEYLTKYGVHPQNHTFNNDRNSSTGTTQINATKEIHTHEIEQKFALSLDAINKLNENIAILQKKFTLETPELVKKTNDGNRNELAEGLVILPRKSVQNIADSLKSQESGGMYISKQSLDTAKLNKNKYVTDLDQDNQYKNINKQLESTVELKNSLNIITENYEKVKETETLPMALNDAEEALESVQNGNYFRKNYTFDNNNFPFTVLMGIPYKVSDNPQTSEYDYSPRFLEVNDYNENKPELSFVNYDKVSNRNGYMIPNEFDIDRDISTPSTYFSSDKIKNIPNQLTAFDVIQYINKIRFDNNRINSSSDMRNYIQTTEKTITTEKQHILNGNYLGLQTVIDYLNYNQNQLSPNIQKAQNEPINTEKLAQEQTKLKDNISDDNKVNIDNPTTFPTDMVIKIADSVKDIVLKNLRKELNASSSNTVSTILPVEVTTKSNNVSIMVISEPNIETIRNNTLINARSELNTSLPHLSIAEMPVITNISDPLSPRNIDFKKVQKATKAIENFIELFEHMTNYKNTNHKAYENKNSLDISKKMIPMPSPPRIPLVLFPPAPQGINPYREKIHHRNIPLVIQTFIPPVQLTNTPVAPSFDVLAPSQNVPPKSSPPLIQTNVNEIQPLPVPMNNPEPINLNIVITTQRPYLTKESKERWDFMVKYGRNPDKKLEIINTKHSLNDYSHIKLPQYMPPTSNGKYINQDKIVLCNNSEHARNEERLKIQNDYRGLDKGYKEIEVFDNRNNNKVMADQSVYMNKLANNKYMSSGNQQNIENINIYQRGYNKNVPALSNFNNTYVISQPNVDVYQKRIRDINSQYRDQNKDYEIPNEMRNDRLPYDPKISHQYHTLYDIPENLKYSGMNNEHQMPLYSSYVNGYNLQEPQRGVQNVKYKEMVNSKQSYDSGSIFQYQEQGKVSQNMQTNEFRNQNPPYNPNHSFQYQETDRHYQDNNKYNEMPKIIPQYQETGKFSQNEKYNELINNYLNQKSYDPKSVSQYQESGRNPQNLEYSPNGNFYNQNPEKNPELLNYNTMLNGHPKQPYELKNVPQYQEQERHPAKAQYNINSGYPGNPVGDSQNLKYNEFDNVHQNRFSQFHELDKDSPKMYFNGIKNEDMKQIYNTNGDFYYQEPRINFYHGEKINSEINKEQREVGNFMLDPRLNKDNRNRFSDAESIMGESKYSNDDRTISTADNDNFYMFKNANGVSLNENMRPPMSMPLNKIDHRIMPTKTIYSNSPAEQNDDSEINMQQSHGRIYENTPVDQTFLKSSGYTDSQPSLTDREEMKQINPIKVDNRFKDLEKLLSVQPKRTRLSIPNENLMILPKLKLMTKQLSHGSKLKQEQKGKYYPSEESSTRELGRVKNMPHKGYDISSIYKNIYEINRHRQDMTPWYESKTATNDKLKQKRTKTISTLLEAKTRLKSGNNGIKSYERPRHAKVYKYTQHNTDSSDEKSKMNSFYETSDTDKQYNNIEIKGFHEKLEGSDSSPDSPSDCGPDEHCTMKILPRDQMPLSGKAKKYNDAHFKNFLKTQQKVNSMLEKILSTRNDEVKSVESI